MQKIVKCKICSLEFKALGYHLRSHNISKQDYCDKFNLKIEDLSSEESKQKRHAANSVNGQKGSDKIQEMLKNPMYKEERGQKISQGILASEHAIKTRKKTLSNLNKSEEFRSKSSSTMKKTWIENSEMSDLSHQWQTDDPERLMQVMSIARSVPRERVFQSKPEKEIRIWLKEDLGYKLNSGRFFIDDHYRFFDIHLDDVLIEIDGPWHFQEFYVNEDGSKRFEKAAHNSEVDRLKEKFALENGCYLLRVSNWGDKLQDQKNIIIEFLENKHTLTKGIYRRGVKYENQIN